MTKQHQKQPKQGKQIQQSKQLPPQRPQPQLQAPQQNQLPPRQSKQLQSPRQKLLKQNQQKQLSPRQSKQLQQPQLKQLQSSQPKQLPSHQNKQLQQPQLNQLPQPSQNQLQPSLQFRLNKFLAERIGVSRREADDLIASGKITINGKTATLGARLDKNDKICYNNKTVPFETDFLYLALNKPVGYVCSRRAQGTAPTLYELLPKEYHHLKTVGRLDKDSSGLILLTNDGDFAFQMTHPSFRKTKVYEVELSQPLEPLHQQMISDYGVMLDDGPSKFKIIKNDASLFEMPRRRASGAWQGEDERAVPVATGDGDAARGESVSNRASATYIVILAEGRNRQIRRTFAALGYRVTKLHRTEFGKYKLGNLASGKYDIIEP